MIHDLALYGSAAALGIMFWGIIKQLEGMTK